MAPLLAAITVLAAVLAPAASVTAKPSAGAGELSARLVELVRPDVRSLSRREQAVQLSLARRGPGSLLRQGNRVLVEVRLGHGAAARLDEIKATGASLVGVSGPYQSVTAAARPVNLARLALVPGVRSVTEILTPIVHQTASPGPLASAYTPCFGAATSEGDVQLRAAEARTQFEIDGTGVEVGILSDSFDRDPLTPTGAAEDVASGDLPGPGNPCGHATPVQVLEDAGAGGGSDEGRAMAQIVHDLAPGAALSFATAFSGEMEFADNIRALAAAGASAIVDDVSYFEEPFFQEGPVGIAVGEVTDGSDVAYFTAAGNDNLKDGEGNDIASWEAPSYRDSGACPAAVAALGPAFNPSHCMDFDPGGGLDRTFAITVSSGATLLVDLQWAESWNGVGTDLDAFLLDPAGGKVLAGSEEDNIVSQRPLEIVGWENRTKAAAKVQLVVNRFAGSSPRLKFILVQNGGGVTATEYPKSAGGDVVGPTIFGHNGAEDAMSLGAIRYNATTAPEPFSSRGPVTHYFGPANGITPALPLGSPLVLAKPDVVATDGGANTFFGSCLGNVWRFFGTSAAAPHAAAVVALEREVEPAASAAAVKQAQRDAAAGVGTQPATAVGAGLLDAVATLGELGAIPPSPGATPVAAPPPGPCPPPRVPPAPPATTQPPAVAPPSPTATRPQTFFRSRPPKLIRTRSRRAKAVFVFGSNADGASFVCRVDTGLFRSCPARFAKRFPLGRHSLRVLARDAQGNADPTPAVYRFRVKRVG